MAFFNWVFIHYTDMHREFVQIVSSHRAEMA